MSIKSKVLKYLETNRDTFVSGQVLADYSSVSRSAINKVIKSLKEQGYCIEAITNRGYKLSSNNDILSPEGIEAYLNVDYPGNIFTYDILESTNKTAKGLAEENCTNYTVVIANGQTEGRGRLGRSFYSPGDTGIYMSVILKPDADADFYNIITVAACVAVFKAIYNVTGIRTGIKWVNDLYINDKKICGILTEGITDLESGRITTAILGIGINISTELFPDELKEIAGSLSVKAKDFILRNKLIAEILNEIKIVTDKQSLKDRAFVKEYRENSIVIGKQVDLLVGNNISSVKVLDIDDDGCLIVENKEGTIQKLSYGEITLRLKHDEN